ncbi:MAG: ABC transporter ATP-binding protein [Dongiaceae bacterium]
MLNVAGITKSFGQQRILDNISLEIKPGEVVCLIGASGSGKTTLLSILANSLAPDMGKVDSAVKRPSIELGFLRQAEDLLPWRTALENVALGMILQGQPQNEATLNQARYWLKEVGLAEAANRYPKQLSGGMQQRILLARTLALKPKLLLLDEPLGHLDVISRRDMAKLIHDYVAREKAAALIVTHSVEEAVFLADRIIVLSTRPARIAATLTQGAGLDQVLAALIAATKREAA